MRIWEAASQDALREELAQARREATEALRQQEELAGDGGHIGERLREELAQARVEAADALWVNDRLEQAQEQQLTARGAGDGREWRARTAVL